eukprot:CAMPEP_0176122892 /NCGR_PEP_ID=MMETSP0120_2-20121206/61904_1 /TAXON_ID=160619 /ORGANISM="Kryptoperidinium foliaceum, Strain CCMP 1326" /LENGTH=59 /DNA_ID=CAMNT_0017457541 /DNA_START=254 /DNA_END=430 /DNA_ORIENTATION=-
MFLLASSHWENSAKLRRSHSKGKGNNNGEDSTKAVTMGINDALYKLFATSDVKALVTKR